MLTEVEDSYTLARLLEFKRCAHRMLRSSDKALIQYPEIDILGWSRSRKKEKLKNLERMHRVYLTELKRDAELLRPITDFFKPKRGGEEEVNIPWDNG